MSVLTSLGIIVMAMLIQTFLQLTPGVFVLFSHYTFGKTSKSKASDFSLFFILGVEIITALLFVSIYFIIYALFLNSSPLANKIFSSIIAGILVALGFISLFHYFRKGSGTKLFIPRKLASDLETRASSAKTRSDAFMLGAFSGICELFFTIPLYIISALEISQMEGNLFSHAALIILYILVVLSPLFIIHTLYATSHNLADIQRFRAKNKLFFRIILSFSYFILAALIIIFRIII